MNRLKKFRLKLSLIWDVIRGHSVFQNIEIQGAIITAEKSISCSGNVAMEGCTFRSKRI